MPRNYQRKTDNGQIPVAVLKEAVARVLANEKVSAVAKDMGIPRTTLRRKVAQLQASDNADLATNFCKAQVFNEAEEHELAVYLDRCSKMFFGLTTKATRQLAFEMAVKNGISHPPSWTENKEAGKEWMMGFMKRHPQLSIRRPEATSLARATSFNRHNISVFFDIIEERITTLKLQARQIFNLDETGFTTVQKMPKVISSRGTKQVGQITSRERGELVTACCIVSATGVALPPVFVFPRKKFQAHMMNNAPEGSKGVVSDSGWMTSEKFLDVLDHFIAHAQPSEHNPALLILDNHESHLSLPALEFAKENNVHIVTLVPHTSNKTQPLDRTVFGPVKSYFNEAATSWMMANPGKTISIYQIAQLVKAAWLQGATPSNIISGFRASGIWPFNRHVFPDYFFAPSDLTDRPQETNPTQPPAAEDVSAPLLGNPPSGPSGCTEPASTIGHQQVSTLPEPQAATSTDHPDHHRSALDASAELPPAAEKEKQGNGSGSCMSAERFLSPAQFRGYPKAPPRSENGRGRKRGKCTNATASPNIDVLRREAAAKRAKVLGSGKAKGAPIRSLVFEDDSDDDISLGDLIGHESSSEDEEDGLVLETVKEVSVGEIILCQFDVGKSTVFYVGAVSKGVDEEGDLEVNFFRKSDKVKGKFVKPQVEEITSVPLQTVKAVLTRVQTSGTTARTKDAYFFKESLDHLNVR